MKRLILAAWLLAFAPAGYADCGELADRVSKALGYAPVEYGFRADCRVWPADPARTIVALAHLQTAPGSGGPPAGAHEEGDYDLDVVVVSTATGAILQRLAQRGALISDALRLDSVSVDTGRFWLAPGVRAFGVRARRANRRAEVTDVRLYVVRGNTLQQVFGPAYMLEHFSEDQLANDCYRSSKVERTLAVARSSTLGHADLIVQEQTTLEEPTAAKDGCEIAQTRSSRRVVVRFDGNAYVVPKELQTGY
jgi:hypothetical protein